MTLWAARGKAATFLVLMAPVFALSACDELGQGGTTKTMTTEDGRVLKVEEREVERPDIYEIEARGLWDGRPSLGGRWVAVNENVNADRVRITNLDNNRQIEGALFKVEDRPGPPIMVSSEAAEPLGMLPGAPARLHVVVVRTETVEVTPQPGEVPPADIEESPALAEAEPVSGDDVAPIETAALETTVLGALDGAEAPAPAPAPEPEVAPVAAEANIPDPDPAGQAELNDLVIAAVEPQGIGGDLKLPYLQVASGTDKARMDEAVRKLNDEGYGASIRETPRDDGKVFYVVAAGPFGNEGGRTNALKRIRALGYKDAFPIK